MTNQNGYGIIIGVGLSACEVLNVTGELNTHNGIFSAVLALPKGKCLYFLRKREMTNGLKRVEKENVGYCRQGRN